MCNAIKRSTPPCAGLCWGKRVCSLCAYVTCMLTLILQTCRKKKIWMFPVKNELKDAVHTCTDSDLQIKSLNQVKRAYIHTQNTLSTKSINRQNKSLSQLKWDYWLCCTKPYAICAATHTHHHHHKHLRGSHRYQSHNQKYYHILISYGKLVRDTVGGTSVILEAIASGDIMAFFVFSHHNNQVPWYCGPNTWLTQ